MIASLGQPAFYLTLAVAQVVIVLVAIRLFDRYEPEPLGLIALVALWGATGAAAISIAGDHAVKGLLSGNVQIVFGDAVSAPIVEECAKGIALVVAVLLLRPLARRFGVTVFEGLNDGLVYGAAVGLGFALTEDFVFFIDHAKTEGLTAGVDLFVARRDFFGPAVLHHAIFTAAFGAGLGLATWTRRRSLKILFPLAGLAVGILMHAANDGLLELGLTIRYGLENAAAWVSGAAVPIPVLDAADSWSVVLGILDWVYIAAFLIAAALWVRYEGRVIRAELVEETDSGLLSPLDARAVTEFRPRLRHEWQLVRTSQFEQLRHERRLHNLAARLALLKWRTRRFGGDTAAVQRARRQIATFAAFEPRPSKIPTPPSPLVGRESELVEAVELLGRRDVRLLTLTGPGGTGKTRLSLEIATTTKDRFPSGAFFVPLADVTDADAVVSAIGQTLELRERPGEGPLETLVDELRDKHLLLVLDNLEQVLVAAAPLSELLRGAPRVKLLATSREPLRIAGEHELGIGPLPQDDAVALFLQRARSVDAGFIPSEADDEAIRAICTRLDGLPLAVELAAARVTLFVPTEIAERLDRSLLAVADSGSRDAPGRHRTLRAAIEWSYDLLGEGERALLARLATFAGGFDVEAAEAVGGDEVLDRLSSLIGKSLVRGATVDGSRRFELLESIHEFALERLEERGDLDAVRSLHAEHYLALAERAEPELRGARQAEWLRRLAREHENFRVAFSTLRERGANEQALRLAIALGPFWEGRGTLEEPQAWLDGALAADSAPPELRARALYALGRLAMLQADYARAETALDEALAVSRGRGDAAGVVRCLWELGFIALVRGDYERAQELFSESLEAARTLGDQAPISRSLASLGRALTELGDVEAARPPLRESLAVRRGAEDTRNVANSLSLLGRRALVAGDLAEARSSLDEALSLARSLDDKLRLAEALYFAALVELEAGDGSRAGALLEERLRLCQELGDRLGIAECLDAEARIAAGEDDERAARLLAAAERLRSVVGARTWPFERRRREATIATVRSSLGERAFEDAVVDGEAMSVEQGIALVGGSQRPEPFEPSTAPT